MARAWQEIEAELLTPVSKVEAMPASSATVRRIDWRKRMSDNIAYALLVYTALQIFVTMSALKSEGGSLLPYLALIILVAALKAST
jgi:hypothetical protein